MPSGRTKRRSLPNASPGSVPPPRPWTDGAATTSSAIGPTRRSPGSPSRSVPARTGLTSRSRHLSLLTAARTPPPTTCPPSLRRSVLRQRAWKRFSQRPTCGQVHRSSRLFRTLIPKSSNLPHRPSSSVFLPSSVLSIDPKAMLLRDWANLSHARWSIVTIPRIRCWSKLRCRAVSRTAYLGLFHHSVSAINQRPTIHSRSSTPTCFTLVRCLISIAPPFCHSHITPEPQPTSSRWRALAHKHIHRIHSDLDDYTVREMTQTIHRWSIDLFLICGSTSPSHDAFRKRFETQVTCISKSACRIARIIREEIMSTNFEVVGVDSGRTFDAQQMTDAFENCGTSEGTVLCTTELGLRCSTQKGTMEPSGSSQENVERRLLLRPKVILESAIPMLDQR